MLNLLLAASLGTLLAAEVARGQPDSDVLGGPYYVAVEAFYSGEYRDATRALGREARRGVNTVQGRWVDSICYHSMLGEVLYQQGRNAEALAEFDQACQLLATYPNWILQLRPEPIRANPNIGRRQPTWGRSQRRVTFGESRRTMLIGMGQLDNSDAIRRGGVVRQPMLWQINATEVVRTAALALRRRNEILGPLASHDPLCRELADLLSRGNLAPANHWTSAWVDLLRGIALVGVGRFDEADTLLERAAIADGQFDHPLTCVALLEQGRLAMLRGDRARAATFLAEAGFSAFYYENWDVLTESAWLGWLNHVSGGGGGMYPPLEPIASLAQAGRFQHTVVRLRLAEAESLVWLGQLQQAASILNDTNRRLGEMRESLSGIHQLYVQAALQVMQRQMAPGADQARQALAAEAGASTRNFQIARAVQMFDRGALTSRVAVDLFGRLLADPTPAEWVAQPLEAIAVLGTNHEAAFDRWFASALDRKDLRLALDVAEASKRRRFIASLPLGGRLDALRTILEAPAGELSPEALLQRQQLLSAFPAYRELSAAGEKLYAELRGGKLLAGDGNARDLAARFDAWDRNAADRELILMQVALRRLPTSLEFPPRRAAADLQKRLADGESLIVFHVAAGNLFGLALERDDIRAWQLGDAPKLKSALGGLLRELGNYNATRALTTEDLESDRWRTPAAELYTAVLADARLNLAKTQRLTIVPDDVLWYVPFEVLIPSGPESKVLADRASLRYGPTAALAVGEARDFRPVQHTGIAAHQFAKDNSAAGGEEAVTELEHVVSGAVRLPVPLPEPGHLLASLLDELVVLDDVPLPREAGLDWSLLERSRGPAGDSLARWLALPYGGPQRIVVTGFSTAAEQGLKATRRSSARAANASRPGSEIFQPLCALMATGARTILLTRWRTGGRTNFELVREFVRELPNRPATEAWQRACVLAREMPLDPAREPRLKLDDDLPEAPLSDHPFFWSGYLLVDSAPLVDADPEGGEGANMEAEATPPAAEKVVKPEMPLPPPAPPAKAE